MIINFPVDTQTYGEYCLACHKKDTLMAVTEAGRKVFKCSACQAQNARPIIIDPAINWWTDDKGTYYHESAGILLVNPDRKILFFELTHFPYGLTAPAGHVDAGETPLDAVIREAKEEVDIDLTTPQLVTQVTIHGDSCSRGSDDHKWSLYIQRISQEQASAISVDQHEGTRPRWVDISEVDDLEVPFAMRFLFNNYKTHIAEMLTTL